MNKGMKKMEKLNYDKIRKYLYNIIAVKRANGFELYEIIEKLSETMMEMHENMSSIFNDLRNKILEILYMDSMKYLLYKTKLSIYTSEENKLLFHLLNFNSMEDIINFTMNNPEALGDLLKNFIDLYEEHELLKMLITKSLTSSEKEKIIKVVPNSEEDLKRQNESIKLELLLATLYVDETVQFENYRVRLSEQNINRLFHVIHQLYIYDKKNGVALLTEIGNLDCNILKQLDINEVQEKDIISRISFYEESSDETTSAFLLNNNEYLLNLLYRIREIMIKKQLLGIKITLEELMENNHANNYRKLKKEEE